MNLKTPVPYDDTRSREERGNGSADPLLIEAFIFVFNWLKRGRPEFKKPKSITIEKSDNKAVVFEELFNKDAINIETNVLKELLSNKIDEFLNREALLKLLSAPPPNRSTDEQLLVDAHNFLITAIMFDFISCYGYFFDNFFSNKANEFVSINKTERVIYYNEVSYIENLMFIDKKNEHEEFEGLIAKDTIENIHIEINGFIRHLNKKSKPVNINVFYLKDTTNKGVGPINICYKNEQIKVAKKNKFIRVLYWLNFYQYNYVNTILLDYLTIVLNTKTKDYLEPYKQGIKGVVRKLRNFEISIDDANSIIEGHQKSSNLEVKDCFYEQNDLSYDCLRQAFVTRLYKTIPKNSEIRSLFALKELADNKELEKEKSNIKTAFLKIDNDFLFLPFLSDTNFTIKFEESFVEEVIKNHN